jgi:FkbM family methyltransferase
MFARVKNKARRALFKALEQPFTGNQKLSRLGSHYGGWYIPANSLNEGEICYCAGVGEDISFDEELVARYGALVYSFDPTPRSKDYVDSRRTVVKFYDFGFWSEDTTLRFYAPQNEGHVSHSVVNLQGTFDYFEGECKRVSSVMQLLGHDRLDLLKIDIEGAEYEVLQDLINSGVRPRILCVEFDQPNPLRRVRRMLKQLRSNGFQVVKIEGWNVSMIYHGE